MADEVTPPAPAAAAQAPAPAAAPAPVATQPPASAAVGAPAPAATAATGAPQPVATPITAADLKVPAGSKLDAKIVESLVSFSKEKGLSKDQAQAILDREHAASTEREAAQASQLKSLSEQWLSAAKTDKELVGEKGDGFNESVTLAQRVVARFGSEEFKTALNETGLGNHPELLKFVARIGKMIGNDKLVVSTATGSQERTASEIFYNTDKK